MEQGKNSLGNIVFEGFVDVEIIDAETGESKFYSHNNITDLGKLTMSRVLSSYLADMSADGYGSTELISQSFRVTSGNMEINKNGNGLVIYLANLDDTSVLSPTSKMLPITKSDGTFLIDESVLTGYGNNAIYTDNPKEAVDTRLGGAYVVAEATAAKTILFNRESGNGARNVLMVGANIVDHPANGFAVYKNLNSKYDVPNFCFDPGMFTENNEILVGGDNGENTRVIARKYNIETGEYTNFKINDLLYGKSLPYLTIYDNTPLQQVKIGDYVYFLRKAGDADTSDKVTSMIKVNAANVMKSVDPAWVEETVTLENLTSIVGSGRAKNILGFFAYDETHIGIAGVANNNNNLINLGIYTVDGVLETSILGIERPSIMPRNQLNIPDIINACDGRFYWGNYETTTTISFTDFNNIMNADTELIPCVACCKVFKINGSRYFYGYIPADKFSFKKAVSAKKVVEGAETYTTSSYKNINVISKDRAGNLISYVVLPEVKTKVSTQELKVTYGYRTVLTSTV